MCDMEERINFQLCLESAPEWDTPDSITRPFPILVLHSMPQTPYFKVFGIHGSELLMIRADSSISALEFTEGLLNLVDRLNLPDIGNKITYLSLKEVYKSERYKHLQSTNPKPRDHRYQEAAAVTDQLLQAIVSSSKTRCFLVLKLIRLVFDSDQQTTTAGAEVLTFFLTLAQSSSQVQMDSDIKGFLTEAVKAPFIESWLKSVRHYPELDQGQYSLASYKLGSASLTPIALPGSSMHPERPATPVLVLREPCPAAATARNDLSASVNFMMDNEQELSTKSDKDSDVEEYEANNKAVRSHLQMEEPDKETKLDNLDDVSQDLVMLLRKKILDSTHKNYPQRLAENVLGLSEVHEALLQMPFIGFVDCVFRVTQVPAKHKTCRATKKKKCKNNHCYDHRNFDNLINIQESLVLEGQKLGKTKQLDRTFYSLHSMLEYFYKNAKIATRAYIFDHLLIIYEYHDSDLSDSVFESLIQHLYHEGKKDFLKQLLVLDHLFTPAFQAVLSRQNSPPGKYKVAVRSILEEFQKEMESYLIQEVNNYTFLRKYLGALTKAYEQDLISEYSASRIVEKLSTLFIKPRSQDPIEGFMLLFSVAGDSQVVKKICFSVIFRKLNQDRSPGILQSFWSSFKRFFGKENRVEIPEEICDYIINDVISDPQRVLVEMIDPKENLINQEVFEFLETCSEKEGKLKIAFNQLKHRLEYLLKEIVRGDMTIEHKIFLRIDKKERALNRLSKHLGLSGNIDEDDFKPILEMFRVQSYLYKDTLDKLRKLCSTNIEPFSSMKKDAIHQNIACIERTNVTLADIQACTRYVNRLSNLIKAVELFPFNTLHDFISQHGKQQSSAEEMEQTCKKALEALAEQVELSRKIIKRSNLDMLKKLSSELSHYDLRRRVTTAKLLNAEDCRDLESLILGCDILDHQHTLVKAKKEVTLMLSEIKKLREETSMQSGQDGLIEKIYRLSNSWTEKYNCNSKELLTLVNNNRNDLEVLKGRSELIENLSRLKDLYKFFKDKQPKHFENMLFDSGEFTSLDIQDITGMQKILEAFNTKTKFDSEFDFIKVCCKSLQSVNIVKIIEKAESLKLCSDAILKGDNNGQKIVEVLHEGGIICFKYLEEANTYLVVGVTSVDYSEGARLISQQLKDGFDIEPHPRLIGHQKLKDTKIRVAVITSDQSGQLSGNQAGFQEKIRTFATIMDNIECIHHHLNILMRVGEILNLKAFMEQLVRKERSLSLSNPFKNQDHSPLDIIRQTFEIQGNDLFIVTNPELPDSLVDKTMHFKAFKELLENYTYTRNQIIFEKMRKFHILSHMNGKQKLLLSKTLTNVDTKNSLQAIPSILEFVTGTTITKLPFKPGSASPEVLVDDVLLKFFEDKGFFTPNNDEDRPLQQSNSKKIKFLRYRSKRKYEDIFDFSSSKGKRILTAQRIMFVSHLTPFPEVDDFLMKAFCDPTGGYYFLCDLHLMRPEATSKLMLVCKLHLEKNAGINLNCVFMISRDHPRSSMLTEMIKHSHIFEEEISFRPDGKQHQPQSRASLQAQYVVSDLPGMGKTFYIEEEAKKSRQELVSMFIGGDPSKKCLEKRLEIIDNFMRNSQGKFLLHLKLDMMDNMEESLDLLDHLLFKLCYLRCIEYRDGYLYLKNVQFIYIEVQNSYKDLILERVNFLRICQPHSIPVLSLDWMNKHLNHGFIGDQKIRTVCSFFLALQDKRLGTASTTNLVDVHFAATNQIKSEVINRILIQILFSNSEVARQLENSGTVQILVYLINVLYYQITQMESVGGLNPSIYQIDSGSPNYQEFIDSLTDSRLTTGRIVFQLAKDLIWSSAKEIREEKMLGTQIIGSSVLSNKNSALRKEYLKKVTSIPKWELAGQLNIFFNEGAMKVLYRDVEQVTNQIKSLIKHQTGKDLEDLSRLSPESRQIKLLGELAEALNLFVTKQVSDEIQNLNPNLRREDIILQSLILEMKNFHQKGYVLTHDNFLKIIMIYQRAVLGIPIVIMGATGCGKTYLIDFISSCLLEEPFILFSMHSGITEKELEDRLLEAYKLAKQDDHRRVWFLFDEFNTSPLQCLISDIMIRRSCSFSLNLANIRFPNNLVFVAACNPFRLASHITKEGLQHDQASLMILAHRVYPIPESLISNIWDFGQLTKEDESEYIMNILDSHGGLIGKDHLKSALCIIIITCQNFLRVKCFDNSVSLRDVKRVVTLFVFFATKYDNPVDPLALTAYLCYFCRLPSESLKQNLSAILTKSLGLKDNIILIFTHRAREYAEELRNMEVVPESISINFPLAENLLAVTACVLNKIPLIICGKPGTSKTLAAKIFQTAIQLPEDQKQSCRLLRESPKVYFMPLWGSLTMTSEAVLQSFRKAEDRKQKLHAQGSTSGNRPDSAENKPIVCVVFDEIGIAEIAPENPLKVLHALLDPQEQTLAFIGMSNWMLDQSKMNRVIFVSRPDMTVEDLIQTCQKESLRGEFSKKYLEFIFSRLDALAKAYYQFREKEKEKAQGGHPNFHGSRDFYETVKTFKRNLSLVIDSTNDDIIGLQEHEIVDSLMLNAIHRNFSGKAISSTELSHQFMTRLIAENCATLKSSIFNDSEIGNRLKTIDLIYQNLTDTNSRHLMIICGSATVEELLVKEIRTFEVEIKKKDSNKIVSLYQGKGREEMVRTVMTKLPLYVKNGYTLIMKDLPEVYGCMYDLLNQNYSKSTDANDRECDLHFENDKATVQVHKDFKCIILMERDDALGSKEDIEAKQQPPFLNRFEKYLIREEDFIEPEKQEVLKEINKIFIEKTASSLYAKPQSVFHNMSKEMLYSAVIDDVSMITKNLQSLPHAGDGSTIYLGYLENVLICINRDTKLNKPTRSALQKSKTSRTKSSESDHKLIENSLLAIEVKKKIISLASRNMIIQNHLFQIAYNLPETFKEDFLESHEFDSFLDYEKQFISGARGLTRAIIFTYSAVWELRSIIRDHYRLKLIEANLLHQKGSGETSSLSLDITLDSAEVLIVQFSNRSEWAIMQNIRLLLDSKLKDKKIIFVAHYDTEDFRLNRNEDSAINFLTKDWEMIVIDDLNGCNYKDTFEILDMDCALLLKRSLEPKSASTRNRFLGNEVIKEGLQQLIVETSDTYQQLARGSRAMQFILKSSRAAEILAERLESQEREGKTVSDLIKGDDLSTIFDNYKDVADFINFKLKNHFLEKAKTLWEDFQKYCPLGTLLLATLLDPEDKDYIGYVLSNSLEENSQSPATAVMARLQAKKFVLGKFEPLLASWLKSVFDYKIQGIWTRGISGLKKAIMQKNWTEIFPEHDPILTPNIHMTQLLSMIYLQKYLKNKEPTLCDPLVLATVRQVALKYEQISKGGLKRDSRYFAVLMVMIAEIFVDDLKVLADCSEFEPSDKHEELAKQFAEEFTKKGTIDFNKYLVNLAEIPQIDCSKDVMHLMKKITQLRKLSISLGSDQLAEDVCFDEESCRMMEQCLTFIRQLTSDPEIIHFLGVFNNSRNRQSHSYADIVLDFVSHLVDNFDLPNTSYHTRRSINFLIRDILNPLIETSFRNQNDEYLVRVSEFLIKVACSMNDLESLACSSVSQLLFPQDISLQFDNLISLIDSLNRYLIQHRHEKGKSICSKINLYSMTQMLHQNGNIQASINSLQELKQCINVLDELLDQKRPFRLLDAEKLRGLTMLVGFISKVKDDYAVLRTDNISTFLDHFISGLAEQPSKQPLALLLMKMLYSIAPSPAKLANDLGLAKVAEVLIEWGRDLEADFLIPNQEEFDKVKDIRTALSLENGDPLEAFDTFNQRIELTNFFLISESLNQGQQRMLPLLNNTPAFQAYFGQISDLIENPSVKDQIILHQLIAMVLNLAESSPASFVYSIENLHKAAFLPMLNYPSDYIRRTLPIIQLGQSQQGIVTIWECSNQACKFLVPIGDCGRIGHLGTDSSKSRCLGCNQPIGQLGDNQSPNLLQRNIADVQRDVQNALLKDESPLRLEPRTADSERFFDDDWILLKYHADLQKRPAALLVHLLQSIFLHLHVTLSRDLAFSVPLDGSVDADRLVLRDFRLLAGQLGKDLQSAATFALLFVWRLHETISTPSSCPRTPAEFRRLASALASEMTKNPNEVLGNYQQIKNTILKKKASNCQLFLGFVKSNLTKKALAEGFSESTVEISSLLKLHPTLSPGVILRELTTNMDGNIRKEFLYSLMNRSRLLQGPFKEMLRAIQEFGSFIISRFNCKLTEEESRSTPLQALISGEAVLSVHKTSNKSRNLKRSWINREDDFIREARKDYGLEREFEKFRKRWIDALTFIKREAEDLLRLRFECEQLPEMFKKLESLAEADTPLICYVISEVKNKDAVDSSIMKSFVESMLKLQSDMFNRFGELAEDERKTPKTRPFYACNQEAFFSVPSIEEVIRRHSYIAFHDNQNPEVQIEYQYLARRLAIDLFGSYNLVSADSGLQYLDSDSKDLKKLLIQLFSRIEVNEERAPPLDVNFSLYADSAHCLESWIKIIITKILDLEEISSAISDSKLITFVETDEREFAHPLLDQIAVSQLEKVRVRLLVEEYTNLVKKIFSAKNSRQQGNDRVAGLKQKNGFTLSDEQRQSCIEQLKAAFTEALRYSEDKDREAKLGMPLDDLVDESCLSLLNNIFQGVASLTWGDLPALVDRLTKVCLAD